MGFKAYKMYFSLTKNIYVHTIYTYNVYIQYINIIYTYNLYIQYINTIYIQKYIYIQSY